MDENKNFNLINNEKEESESHFFWDDYDMLWTVMDNSEITVQEGDWHEEKTE